VIAEADGEPDVNGLAALTCSHDGVSGMAIPVTDPSSAQLAMNARQPEQMRRNEELSVRPRPTFWAITA
jgi:hypothetical protein